MTVLGNSLRDYRQGRSTTLCSSKRTLINARASVKLVMTSISMRECKDDLSAIGLDADLSLTLWRVSSAACVAVDAITGWLREAKGLLNGGQ